MPQLLHLSVGDIRILGRRTFVCRMSCITFRPSRYRSAVNVLLHSVPICIWPYFGDARILYTCFNSTYVICSSFLSTFGFHKPLIVHIRRIHRKRLRYSKFSGMISRNRGLAPFTFRPHVRIQADVILPCFITCRIRYKSKSWLFAGKFVKSQSSFLWPIQGLQRYTKYVAFPYKPRDRRIQLTHTYVRWR